MFREIRMSDIVVGGVGGIRLVGQRVASALFRGKSTEGVTDPGHDPIGGVWFEERLELFGHTILAPKLVEVHGRTGPRFMGSVKSGPFMVAAQQSQTERRSQPVGTNLDCAIVDERRLTALPSPDGDFECGGGSPGG